MKKTILFLMILMLVAAGSDSFAQIATSNNFNLNTQVIDQGGRDEETSSGNFYMTLGTLGQSVVGYSNSNNFNLYGGYISTSAPSEPEPGQVKMDVLGLIDDLTDTDVEVDDITAVVAGQDFTAHDVLVTEGQEVIHIFAKDHFGHTTAFDVNFTLDITPPTQPVLNEVTTPTETTPQTIAGSKEADTAIWIIRDAKEMEIVALDSSTTWNYDLDLVDGENPFIIYAKDEASNESTRVEGNIYFDQNDPEIHLIYPVNGSYVNKTTITVLGEVEDDNMTVKVQDHASVYHEAVVNNKLFTVTNFPMQDNAWNPITAVAISPGGKQFPAPISVYCDTAITLPDSPILDAVLPFTKHGSQVITGTKPPNTYLWLNEAQTPADYASTSWSLNISLHKGGNPLLLYVKESLATNAVSSKATLGNIFYDPTPPTKPFVIDDGWITFSKTQLHAKWVSYDDETELIDNKYAIGTMPGGDDIVGYTSDGQNGTDTIFNNQLTTKAGIGGGGGTRGDIIGGGGDGVHSLDGKNSFNNVPGDGGESGQFISGGNGGKGKGGGAGGGGGATIFGRGGNGGNSSQGGHGEDAFANTGGGGGGADTQNRTGGDGSDGICIIFF